MTDNHPQIRIHRQSTDPQTRDKFWLKAAQNIHWHKPPAVSYGRSSNPDASYLDPTGATWFPDAQLNTCYNACDRFVYSPSHSSSIPVTVSPDTPHLALAPSAHRVALHHVSPLSFQTQQTRSITYLELLKEVQIVAGILRHKGVAKGDAVVIYMPMIPETSIAMLACARIGAVHSVVFGGFAPKELAKRIQDSGCKMVIAASCGLEPKGPVDYKPLVDEAFMVSEHKPQAGLLYLRRHTIKDHSPAQCANDGGQGPAGLPEWDWEIERGLTESKTKGRSPVWECVPVASEDPVYTIYTSGTTGAPKGVCRLSGGHIVALRYSIEHTFGLTPNDVMFCASDLGWVVGHSYIHYGPLLLGATSVVFEGKPILPDAGIWWRIVSEYKVTQLFCAPTALRAIVGQDPDAKFMRAPGVDLRSLRTLFLAGERSEPQIVAKFEKLLQELGAPGAQTNDNFWSSESGSPITGLMLSSAFAPLSARPGSAGLPMPGMDVRIVSDEGVELPRGQMGNLVLAPPLAPSFLGGLWRNKDRFFSSYFKRFADKGGWFETGDQGIIDADGYISILARSDDIINVSAHRLGTGLIEQVVTGHADVIECAVVGAPDKLKGQCPFAIVVAHHRVANASGGEPVDSARSDSAKAMLKSINDHVRKEMGAIAQLSGLIEVTKLPKTRSGKTLRRSLRQAVENAAAGKRNASVDFPPTIEDKEVIDVVRKAIELYFDALEGSSSSSTSPTSSDTTSAPPKDNATMSSSAKATMKALQLEKPTGSPNKRARNVAALRTVPKPEPTSDKVVVKILAASFNRRDEWSMVGAYPGLIYNNATMGCDGAGTVEQPDGSEVPNNEHPDKIVLINPTRGWTSNEDGPELELPGLSPEQRINGLGGKGFGILGAVAQTNGVGTFAEYVAVEKDQLVPAPKHLTPEQAAALPCASLTAYRALFIKAKVSKGQNLLLTGVGGGVAMLALQMAVAAGANVYVTGGSADKVARAVKIGAKGGAEYKDPSWPSKIRELLPSSRPYLDCVVDSAGGEIAMQASKAGLKSGGRVVIYGMTASPKTTFTMKEVLKNIEVLGSTLGSFKEFAESIKFIEKHRIVPVVDIVLNGLDQAEKGFELLAQADKRSGGKVILKIADLEGKKSKL
ncbi:related to acyl-CoA synthetase [Melanopsichium pennsylvanicum]|uniref:Related to acyl-CoA synthetase n=2 Tax=Melanopsichium pennsylvanicum TaxID=63383 RepID=A0AAJ4XFZ0_9BASI|nr:propionate-ligase [Melanopsichium pennsylvanicum 4]SNX81679.1 related to acyl-CoA synthetase [Melanopsichium pennsylvanicum]